MGEFLLGETALIPQFAHPSPERPSPTTAMSTRNFLLGNGTRAEGLRRGRTLTTPRKALLGG